MLSIRTFVALAVLGASTLSFGQSAGDAQRGSTPPGTSRDGSKPADGAITGGSILPGESAGTPSAGTTAPSHRCDELSGTLREQCLRDATREKHDSCDSLVGPDKERCLHQGGTVKAGAGSN
jgi:hypothetical protein